MTKNDGNRRRKIMRDSLMVTAAYDAIVSNRYALLCKAQLAGGDQTTIKFEGDLSLRIGEMLALANKALMEINRCEDFLTISNECRRHDKLKANIDNWRLVFFNLYNKQLGMPLDGFLELSKYVEEILQELETADRVVKRVS